MVLAHAEASVNSFFVAYETVRADRGAAARPTTAEQDLIRAAVVFAGAGLDSAIKHLIRETLPKLATFDTNVRSRLETFVTKRIRKDMDSGEDKKTSLLASALVAPDASVVLIESYVLELTGSSLQSVEELLKTADALDVDNSQLVENKAALRETFKIRNKIIHELDVEFGGGRGARKRVERRRDDIQVRATLLIDTGKTFVRAVEAKLKSRF